jgi:photosystem II stability/assembly factor-like uncharacterized protein
MWCYSRNLFCRRTFLVVLCVTLLTGNAVKQLTLADELTTKIDLMAIPTPYSFYRFCRLASGDLWTVGGRGQIIRQDAGSKSRIQHIADADLLGVFFIDNDTGWVVGTKGTIFFTADAGDNWTKQNSGVGDDLEAITCIGTNLCWAVGDNGTGLRTKDGGLSWEKMSTGVQDTLFSIDFIDEKAGWAVGGNGAIVQTQDSGAHWTARTLRTKASFGNQQFSFSSLLAVKFFDNHKGWVAGSRGIFQTDDGGITWKQRINDEQVIIGLVINRPNKVWAIGNRGINYHTNDLGKVWTRYATHLKQ